MNRALALSRRAVEFEIAGWRSLGRWVLRRPDVAPGDTPFAYHGPMLAPMVVMTLLSVLEIVAVDLLLPWQWLRPALLVLGIWGTVLMLGILAGVLVHPHAVGPAGLRVRHGAGLDVRIPWDAIAAVRRARRGGDGQGMQLDGAVLHVVVSGQTTVEVVLRRPVAVTLPGRRTVDIGELRFHADDPAALVAATRARVEAAEAR